VLSPEAKQVCIWRRNLEWEEVFGTVEGLLEEMAHIYERSLVLAATGVTFRVGTLCARWRGRFDCYKKKWLCSVGAVRSVPP
jgi:hypothetical protein